MGIVRFLALIAALTFVSVNMPGQAPKSAPKASAKAADKASDKSAVASQTEALVDINRATAAELKTIPGVGDAYSAAIIKGRPYANKTQLKTRNIIPAGVYEKIKDKIIAKQ